MFIILGLLSAIVGAINAVPEVEFKKFLGYTTVNQIGFFMIILAYGDINTRNACFFFLFTYILMLTSLFAVILHRLVAFNYLTDIAQSRSKLDLKVSFSLVIILLSMAGLPFTLGFLSKSSLFFSIIHLGMHSSSVYFIILVLLLNSVSSFYYYTYIIKLLLTVTDFSPLTKNKYYNNFKLQTKSVITYDIIKNNIIIEFVLKKKNKKSSLFFYDQYFDKLKCFTLDF